MSEGEKEEQDFENLFENIMKNFPNLAKETHFQEFQETQRVPNKLDPRKHTPRHIIITLLKVKDKEKILKASKRKGDSYLQRSPHKGYQLISQKKPYRQDGAGKKYSKS